MESNIIFEELTKINWPEFIDSAILIGSVSRGEHVSNWSDIDLILILKRLNKKDLNDLIRLKGDFLELSKEFSMPISCQIFFSNDIPKTLGWWRAYELLQDAKLIYGKPIEKKLEKYIVNFPLAYKLKELRTKLKRDFCSLIEEFLNITEINPYGRNFHIFFNKQKFWKYGLLYRMSDYLEEILKRKIMIQKKEFFTRKELLRESVDLEEVIHAIQYIKRKRTVNCNYWIKKILLWSIEYAKC